MFRQATARLARRSFPSNISAAKSRVAQWEPALSLPQFWRGNTTRDKDDGAHWMTTYSAFDPGMMRPLLLNGIPLDVKRINLDVFSVPKSPTPAPHTRPIANKLAKPSDTQPIVNVPAKPWPYSLPAFLRPRPGTTFEMMHGGGLVDLGKEGRVGFLQAVLYGVPDPDKDGEKKGGVVRVQECGPVVEKVVVMQSEAFKVLAK